MQKYKPLFAWWVVNGFIGWLVAYLQSLGVPMLIYTIDVTHVTQAIVAVGLIADLWIGLLSWKMARGIWTSDRLWKHMNAIWFHCNQMFLLGIIGTVCGSMYLFYSSFGSIAKIVGASFQQIVSNVLPALGIIFSTTALAVSWVFIISEMLWLLVWLSGIKEEKA